MDDVKILATGLGFPEGPVVCADGSVVLVGLRNRRCSRVAPDRKVSLFLRYAVRHGTARSDAMAGARVEAELRIN